VRIGQPDGWADRIARSVHRGHAKEEDEEWTFLGSCVELTGELIDHITEVADEKTWAEWAELGVNVGPLEAALKYGEDIGLTLANDTMAQFFTSQMPSEHPDFPEWEVASISHSHIDYVWVRNLLTGGRNCSDLSTSSATATTRSSSCSASSAPSPS
jgi:hypothetical protein